MSTPGNGTLPKEVRDQGRQLHAVVYHYVRDRAHGRFCRLKGVDPEQFATHVDALMARFEMATVESAMAFLSGAYQPDRDLCLLTFDDGLKEHHAVVTPILAKRRVQGVFAVTTTCPEGGISSVHKNH